MNKISIFKLTFFFLVPISFLMAQQSRTGTVTSNEGPLPGATIVVMGTSNGTT